MGRVQDLVKEEYLNIPALEEKLRDMKKQFEDLHAMAEGNANAFKGDVNIQAHKDVEFTIIKRVMFSCASAGYNNINFATLPEGRGGAERAHGRRRRRRPPTSAGPSSKLPRPAPRTCPGRGVGVSRGMHMHLRAALFDLDGTLVDSLAGHRARR